LENKNLHFEAVDVTLMSDCERATVATITKFGKIDVLINNAGITRDAAFLSMTTRPMAKGTRRKPDRTI
jgi:NAD(P)-dependent dehydrogenase (short-subunit alcohol dehydrogenase family)